MRPTGYHEMSVQNYQSVMRKIPEERKYNLHHGSTLKSSKVRQDFGT
jgi:hypothetical protein